MTDYVRVKDKETGHEFSVPAARFDEAAMNKLDRPAVDAGGELIPVKFRTTKGGQSAASKKEK